MQPAAVSAPAGNPLVTMPLYMQLPAMPLHMQSPAMPVQLQSPMQKYSPGQGYACEHACGFISHSYQLVAQHEPTCSRQPALEMTMQMTQAPSGRLASLLAFTC